jgi:hypothetical protein
MNYQTILAEQALREQRIQEINAGQVQDNGHIELCLRLSKSEPDDVVRMAARLWLQHQAPALAARVLGL